MCFYQKAFPNVVVFMIFSRSCLACLGVVFLKTTPAVSLITLYQTVDKTLKHATSLGQRASEIRAAEYGKRQAYTGFHPQINGEISWHRNRFFNMTTQGRHVGYNRSYGINVTQPIFSGGQTVNTVRAAKQTLLAAHATYDHARQSLILEAASQHFDLLGQFEKVQQRKKSESTLNRHWTAEKERLNVGQGTKVAVALARSRYEAAKAMRIGAEGTLKIMQATYERLAGYVPHAQLEMFIITPTTLTEADAITRALKQHGQLKAVNHTVQAAHHKVNAAKGALAPSLSASATWNRNANPSTDNTYQTGHSVGLTLKIPLLPTNQYHGMRVSKETRRQARYKKESLKRHIIESVKTAWQQSLSAKAKLEAHRAQRESAQLAFQGQSLAQKMGSATTLEVLDAEKERSDAETALISARTNLFKAYLAQYFATGDLHDTLFRS
jgi:outer membrane protein